MQILVKLIYGTVPSRTPGILVLVYEIIVRFVGLRQLSELSTPVQQFRRRVNVGN